MTFFSVKGKVVIITGSSKGISGTPALGFTKSGASVVLFVASGASDYMTGSIVWADAGFLTS